MCYIAQSDFRRRRVQFVVERDSIRRHLRRRRAMIKSGICTIVGFGRLSNRRMWARDRSHGDAFWSTVENFPDEQWMAHFHMSRGTFQYVLDLLTPVLTKKKTNCRKPIAPNRRLAIVLWWYTTPGEYKTIYCLAWEYPRCALWFMKSRRHCWKPCTITSSPCLKDSG